MFQFFPRTVDFEIHGKIEILKILNVAIRKQNKLNKMGRKNKQTTGGSTIHTTVICCPNCGRTYKGRNKKRVKKLMLWHMEKCDVSQEEAIGYQQALANSRRSLLSTRSRAGNLITERRLSGMTMDGDIYRISTDNRAFVARNHNDEENKMTIQDLHNDWVKSQEILFGNVSCLGDESGWREQESKRDIYEEEV